MTERQRHHILHQRGAVQLTGIHHQLFLVVHLQRMRYIGPAHQQAGEMQCPCPTRRLSQRPFYKDAIRFLLCKRTCAHQHQQHAYHTQSVSHFFSLYFFFKPKLIPTYRLAEPNVLFVENCDKL